VGIPFALQAVVEKKSYILVFPDLGIKSIYKQVYVFQGSDVLHNLIQLGPQKSQKNRTFTAHFCSTAYTFISLRVILNESVLHHVSNYLDEKLYF
jgi:hypothetical protein